MLRWLQQIGIWKISSWYMNLGQWGFLLRIWKHCLFVTLLQRFRWRCFIQFRIHTAWLGWVGYWSSASRKLIDITLYGGSSEGGSLLVMLTLQFRSITTPIAILFIQYNLIDVLELQFNFIELVFDDFIRFFQFMNWWCFTWYLWRGFSGVTTSKSGLFTLAPFSWWKLKSLILWVGKPLCG